MDWLARVRAAFADTPRVPDDDVIEELTLHARAEYDAARAEGLSADEADSRVDDLLQRWRRDAGALDRPRRTPTSIAPPAAPQSPLAGLALDTRYAARLLARQPRDTCLFVLTTAIGIGALAVLFSVAYGVLLRPLPWPEADRLVVLQETRGGRAPRFGAFTNAAYLSWLEDAKTIDAIAAWTERAATVTGAGDPERIQTVSASASLFPMLAIAPLAGSLFTAADEGAPVILLSERLWHRRYGGDPAIVGKLVGIDGQPHRVIGVLPTVSAYPSRRIDAWTPFRVAPVTDNMLSMFSAIARLRPDATSAQAAAEGTSRGRFAPDTGMTTTAVFGGTGPIEIRATALLETLTGEVRRPILILVGAMLLLMFAAAGNLAGLQIARATARRREMAIRVAIGAGGWRLARQLLVENLLLGVTGGIAGVVLAWWLHQSLPTLLPADFPRLDDVRLDGAIIGAAGLASLVLSLVIGWLPALQTRASDLSSSLSDGGLAPVGVGRRSRTSRARGAVMTAQVAVACVLLIGGTLLGRSFLALLDEDRGYDPRGVHVAQLSLPSSMYPPARRFEIVTTILERLAAASTLAEVGLASELPLTPGGSTAAFTLDAAPDGTVVSAQASPRLVSARAFAALGMRVVEGRAFTDAETETSEPVAIVNRAFARKYFGDQSLDRSIPMGVGYQNPGRVARIVGVVADVRYVTARDATHPEVYYSYRQLGSRLPVPAATIVMRSSLDPGELTSRFRAAVRDADAQLVAGTVTRLEDRIGRLLARPRLYAAVLGMFAACALVVAAIGLFAVLSYSVAQRSRELAVRSALGARAMDLGRLVVGQGLAIGTAGVAAGIVVSWILTPLLGTLLYGVAAHDLGSYAVVSGVLLSICVLASLGPARRAARLDTLKQLRS
jgi:predicted permease